MEGGHGPFRGLDAPFALWKNLIGFGGEVNCGDEQEKIKGLNHQGR
jgi:hypothetical protein